MTLPSYQQERLIFKVSSAPFANLASCSRCWSFPVRRYSSSRPLAPTSNHPPPIPDDPIHDTRPSLPERRSCLRPLAPVPLEPLTTRQSINILSAGHHRSYLRTELRSQRVLLPASPLPGSCPQPQHTTQPTSVVVNARLYPNPLLATDSRLGMVDFERLQVNLDRALCFLRDEQESRAVASDVFPPDISSSHIRASVTRYEDGISAAAN